MNLFRRIAPRVSLIFVASYFFYYAILHRKFVLFFAPSYRFRSLFTFQGNGLLVDQFGIDCDGLLGGNQEVIENLKNWTVERKVRHILEKHVLYHSSHCPLLQEFLGFHKEPLSQEEAEFPLAYGILVYKNILQVLLMLGGFYHPQNQYCIGISAQADARFRSTIKRVAACFPNMHDRPSVDWGGFEIINSTYACFDYLVRAAKPWKYYQYLSGVDIPLKTNFEMVKILKTWNGSSNMDVLPFEDYRLYGKKKEDSPLPLYKSSVSVIIPRESAEFIVNSSVTQDLLQFINGTGHSDETFWGTLMGNKKKFPVPGAFDAAEVITFRKKFEQQNKDESDVYKSTFKQLNTIKFNYYVARMHVWDISPDACKGFFTNYSCVFGVEDLIALLTQPHFIGHKLYLDYQPATLICGLQKIRKKTKRREVGDISLYPELPLVQNHNGIPLEKIKRPLWLLGETFR